MRRTTRSPAVGITAALAVTLGLLLPALASATIIHVPGDQPTIASALAIAQPDDQVLIAAGTYDEHDLELPADVRLEGETGNAQDVVIDAQEQGRVLAISFANISAEVRDITLTGGDANRGGAVFSRGTRLTLHGCRVQNNRAHYGGGIFVAEGECELDDCLIVRNESDTFGGGLYVHGEAELLAISTLIASNYAETGGGAWYVADGGSLSLDHGTIADNSVVEAGGEGAAFAALGVVVQNTAAAINLPIWTSLPAQPDLIELPPEPTAERCLLVDAASVPQFTCSVRYFGGFLGPIADQEGVNGNVAADPRFCRRGSLDEPDLRFGVAADSPCLPANSGGCDLIGVFGQSCDTPLPVPDVPTVACVLETPAPNPFNPITTIRFAVRESGHARLDVYDLTGRRVATLVDGTVAAGGHEATWRGLDVSGRRVASGVYLCRLVAGGLTQTRSLTMVK